MTEQAPTWAERVADQIARRQHAIIETAAEMAMTSGQYGVLVIVDQVTKTAVFIGMSSTVPYGCIYYQEAGVRDC